MKQGQCYRIRGCNDGGLVAGGGGKIVGVRSANDAN